jgi:predicted CoA-binding protein
MSTSIAVIGATNDRSATSNKAVRAYRDRGYQVFPITEEADEIEGIEAYESVLDVIPQIDVASFHVPPEAGLSALQDCAQKGVVEVYFNPGSGSDELVAEAKALNMKPIEGCSIRAIGVDPESL